MKNIYIVLFLGLSWLGYGQSNGTVLIETTSNENLVVCGDPVTFTIKITNSDPGTLTGVKYTSKLPDGITIVSSQYTNTGDDNNISFTIPDILGNSNQTFTYTAKGDCLLLEFFDQASSDQETFSLTNSNRLVYSIDNGVEEDFTDDSEFYNINFPELFVKVKDQDVNIQVGVLEKDADGTVFNREIEVVNSGLGAIREYRLYVDFDPAIDFDQLRLASGAVLTPSGAVINSPLGNGLQRLEYVITDFSTIGDGDGLFEQDEKFTFIDTVSLDTGDCNPSMQTNYTAVYGCAAAFCEDSGDEDATSVNYISFVQGGPRFGARTILEKAGDFCGDPIRLRYEYTNFGSGSGVSEADTGFDIGLTENSEIFRNVGVNTIKINGVTLSEAIIANFFRYDFSLNENGIFSSDPDGAGVGLDDIDKDGVYDDLPVGATLSISVEFKLDFDPAYIDNINYEQLSRNTVYGSTNACSRPAKYSGSTGINISSSLRSASDVVPDQLESGDTEVFQFKVDYNYGIFFRDNLNLGVMNPVTNYVSRFKLPEGYTINSVIWHRFSSGTDANAQSLSASSIGNNQYEVRGGGGPNGRYEVSVTVQCSDSLGENIDTVDWNMYVDLCGDYSSLELLEMASTSTSIFTIFDRCTTDPGGPGGGGDVCDFTTESFDVNRNTFGYVAGYNGNDYYTQSELGSVPRVTANTPDIELDAAYPLDKVLFSGLGTLDTDAGESYNELSFSFAYNLPETVTTAFFMDTDDTDGELLVNGASYVLDNPVVVIGTNRITYTYTVAVSPVSGTGVTLEVKDLELEVDKRSNIALSRGVYELPIFRGKFSGTSTDGNTQNCGTSVGTDFSLYIPDISIFVSQFANAGCVSFGNTVANLSVLSATTGDDFANEYRPIASLDRASYSLPSGYILRDDNPFTNSAHYYSSPNASGFSPFTNYTVQNNIVDLSFSELITPSAENNSSNTSVYSSFEPDCDAGYETIPMGSTTTFASDVYYRNLIEDPDELVDYFASQNRSNVIRLRDYYNIPFKSTVNEVQEGFERTTDWPVQFCNESTSSSSFFTISNPWIALELEEDDSSTILVGARDQNGNIIPDENITFYGPINPKSGKPRHMLVKMGNTRVARQTCITIYPIAEYRVCENDVSQNINLLSSWACDIFPLQGDEYDEVSELSAINSLLDPGVVKCQFIVNQDIVTLRYKTGDLDWEVNRLQDEVELCEATEFEIKVVSAKFANVYDTKVTVDLPEGVSVSDISQLTYSYDGSTNISVPTSFVQQNVSTTEELVIDASGLVTDLLVASGVIADASESTIPGIRLPGKNEITFKLSLTADCNYNPGKFVTFNLQGTTNCSENISIDLARLIPIKGIVLPDLDIDILADDFLVCDDRNEVSVVVTNTTTDPVAQQQLVLTLPAGVVYDTVVSGFPVPSSTTPTTISWDMADLQTNVNQVFKMKTRLTNSNTLGLVYSAETIQNGQATCIADNQSCELKVTTAEAFIEVSNTPFPQITINPASSIPVCEGDDVVVEVLLSGSVSGGSYTYTWSQTPVAINGNQFTFRPLDSAQLQVTVQSTSNTSANCSGTAQLFIGVYPGAAVNMVVDEGVSCTNQTDGQVSLTITGEQGSGYTEQEPFELIDATYPELVTIGQQFMSAETLTVTNLPQGDFSLTFKDNYGCTFEQSIGVPRVNSPIGSFCATLLACGATSGDIEISFNTLDIHSAITGTNYTGRVYNASSGSNEDLITFTGTFIDSQIHQLSDVSTTAVYILEILAENGCTYTRGFRPQALQVSPRVTNDTDPDFYTVCFANETRDIVLGISNNVNQCTDFQIPSYTVLFGLVDENQDFIGDPQVYSNVGAILNLEEVGIGSYKVSVLPSSVSNYREDIALCEATLFFEITSKSKFTAVVEHIDPTCFEAADGSAFVTVTGGTGIISYEWTNVATEEIISIGYSANGLSAGDYQVIVSDQSGCGSADPFLFTIENPAPLEVPIIEDIQTSCDAIAGSGIEGGTASGYTSGTAPYVFAWYEITEQEIVIADGSTVIEQVPVLVFEETVSSGGTSNYLGIKPANYQVTVTDANGCSISTSITAVTQPPVVRKYKICLSWETATEKEGNPTAPIDERVIKPIGPSDFRQAIAANVERCVIDSQAQLEANVDAAINDVDALDDAVVLRYNQGASEVYHFTLYYYDRAGNLVRTVPPEGVQTVDDRVATAHTYVTGYEYNSIAQLSSQNTPDGGSSQFIYNDIGQLWYSQNERQIREEAFSYVIYDELGRVREGGEAKLVGKTFPDDFLIDNQANPQVAFNLLGSDKLEFIQTTYNDQIEEITYLGQNQRFLRNNVSYINNQDKNGDITKTYYSYDPHGNVEWCIQELPGIGTTTVAYTYDLVSGNVNEVHFNKGKLGEYRHKYTYDEDNRIVSVQTSKDGYLWDEDARYDYYLHGPLMRTEIGEDKVQGLDYTYTIHGWLKGINTPNLEQSAYSPDGNNIRGDIATKHAKDEFGMALGYYQGDFTRDGVLNSGLTAANPFNLENQVNGVQQNLYNGNISTWTSQVAEEAKDKNRNSYITGNAYRYDQLNRIKESTAKLYSDTNQGYDAIGGNADAFKTAYSYDKNGNLMTLKRHKDDGQLMDDLVYHYDLDNPNLSNQLTHVEDGAGQISAEINDLPNQSAGNYEYDETGQLIRDNSEGLRYVWTAAGKVSEIIPDNTNDPETQKVYMSFTYDGMGMRAVKQVNRLPYNTAGEGPQIHNPAAVETTYYSCDASGNVMGIYKREDVKTNPDDATDNTYTASFSISERPIYGSDRVGQDVLNEIIYTRTYGFDSIENYTEIAVEFMRTITNALSTVLLVQNNDQELTDVAGNSVEVTATTISNAKADKAFNVLTYETQQTTDTQVLPIDTNNNVVLIEDTAGEVISYGMVARNYFSADPDRSVLLLYDTDGQLVPGLELINDDALTPIDPQAKTVVVRHPSNPSEYLLFYRDVDADLHCATLRDAGGLAITKHQGFAYSNYGRHMAVIQDEQQKIAYLYATVFSEAVLDDDGNMTSPSGMNLVRFTIDQAGVANFDGTILTEQFASFDTEGNGELQIATDGTAISVYHNTSLPAAWTENIDAEIRTWQLDATTRLPIDDSVTAVAVTNGNIGKGSFINTGDDIYYTQYTQEVSTSTDNKVVKRASDGQIVTANGLGDLRINKDDKLYQFVSSTDTGQEFNFDTQTLAALTNLPSSTTGSTGFQPYQPYTVLKTAEEATSGIVYRNIGDKYYELKDHLGNVRVVVGDRKNLDPTTGALTASVESYNDYYPFGMLKPNRHKSSENYRYGFNGMEKDDEIKGAGNSYNTYYRLYDSRISRWKSVDPKAAKMPWQSPYVAMDNNPIVLTDPKGDCPQCVSGAIIGLFTEYIAQVGANMLGLNESGERMSFSEATDFENLDKTDLLSATLIGGAEGFFTGGTSRIASFFAKSRNRKIAALVLEKSIDFVFNFSENMLKEALNDPDIDMDDVKNSLYGALIETGLGSLFSKNILKKYISNQKALLNRAQKQIAKAQKRGLKPKKKYIEQAAKAEKNLYQTSVLEEVINIPGGAAAEIGGNVGADKVSEISTENENSKKKPKTK